MVTSGSSSPRISKGQGPGDLRRKKMRHYYLSLYLLAVALFVVSSGGVTATLEESCKGIRVVDLDFCVTSLQADPGSRSADTHGLALIAVNLTIANATSTIAKVEQQLKNNASDPLYRSGLEACRILYSSALPALKWSADVIVLKHYDSAEEVIGSSGDAGVSCGIAFESKVGETSPFFAKENEDYTNLALIAEFITKSLI